MTLTRPIPDEAMPVVHFLRKMGRPRGGVSDDGYIVPLCLAPVESYEALYQWYMHEPDEQAARDAVWPESE